MAAARGVKRKIRTTSQSLDQLRLVLDLSRFSDIDLPMFSFFYREEQKLWDGVVGLALADGLALLATDQSRADLLPVDAHSFPGWPPVIPSVLIGPSDLWRWLGDRL